MDDRVLPAFGPVRPGSTPDVVRTWRAWRVGVNSIGSRKFLGDLLNNNDGAPDMRPLAPPGGVLQ